MRNQIIQYNKFCPNYYLCIEHQVQEKETMRRVFLSDIVLRQILTENKQCFRKC